jgi:putative tryptophan/tyrosine transport system substrate-binding protein
MRRRQFIAGFGSAAAWPLAARAQQDGRIRRVGVLMPSEEGDPYFRSGLSVLAQALTELGWTDGRNLRIDVRWAAGDVERARMLAKELVELQPDVLFVQAGAMVTSLQRETRTIPIVFANVADPVARGLVAGLSRPGGNITGFASTEASLGGKWLELLVEIAPAVKRAAIMFGPDGASILEMYSVPAFEAAARSLGVAPITALVQNEADIESVMASFGRDPAGGLVVNQDPFTATHRTSIISSIASYNVPAVFTDAAWARFGGLLGYGPNRLDIIRRSAAYVDRVLRGEKPADLPVQGPTKFEMVLNARTAKAIGLVVAPSILLRADEVIE